MKITLNKTILEKNQECALANSAFFADNNVLCFNVISSPGSGKTTVLAKTITDIKDKFKIAVIEGDLKTDNDARRIRATGAAAVQIETRGSCHLSAKQVTECLGKIGAADMDIVFIENVGNLVCPSDFDLGEQARIVVLSVPEGDDKPQKYPGTFAKADAVLINKIDLIDYIDFDIEKATADIAALNPKAKIFQICATDGRGMEDFYTWLAKQTSSCK